MAKRRRGPSIDWKITLPVELALNIENLFIHPENPKPDYGAKSALIVKLLEDYWTKLPPAARAKAMGVT